MDGSIKIDAPPPPVPAAPKALPAAEPAPPRLPSHQRDPKRARRWLYGAGVLLLVLAALGALTLSLLRKHRETAQAKLLNEKVARGPILQVAKVKLSRPERKVVFPGDARAFFSTSLYGKTAGYLKSIAVDKGDHVAQNALLAVIESPETDQEVFAAQADLVLKEQIAQRDAVLVRSGVVSKQDNETADSNLRTSRANLRRARALESYEVLRAPFAGTVTARYVDPGALIAASTGSTNTGTPVVDLADIDTLRVTIYLGQDVAPFVKVGDQVELWRDQRPTQIFVASVNRMAGALDPQTRTMLTEVWLDNRTAHIFPGTYVRVRVTIKSDPIPSVPAEALFFRNGTLLVGVVEGQKVRFSEVVEAENDGVTVRLSSGVKEGESVLLNVPSDLEEGARVQVKTEQEKEKGAGATKGGQPPSTSIER